jgi:hypothetical protein
MNFIIVAIIAVYAATIFFPPTWPSYFSYDFVPDLWKKSGGI